MLHKLRAAGRALLAPCLYWVIQLVTALAFIIPYGLSWAQTHDIGDRSAFTDALTGVLDQNGLGVMLAAALLGIGMAFLLIRREPAAARTGLLHPPNGVPAVFLVVCGLSLNVLANVLLSLIPFPESIITEYSQTVETLTGGNPAVQFLVVCLIVPIAEEVIFRGVSYRALRRAFPVWLALVLQALLFAAFHGNLLQAVGVFPVALALGLVFEWSGSLVAPILLHAAFNSANALLEAMPENTPDAVFLLVVLAAVAGASVSISSLHRRRRVASEFAGRNDPGAP